jgi:hypothetical protein
MWHLHEHVSGNVLAAGFFSLAMEADAEQRRRIVDAVFDVGRETRMLDVLAKVSIGTEEGLSGFVEKGFKMIASGLGMDGPGLCCVRPGGAQRGGPPAAVLVR